MRRPDTYKEAAGAQQESKPAEPPYYVDNGLLVFTAAYHIARGYCCKNGCRHCPYGFKKKQ